MTNNKGFTKNEKRVYNLACKWISKYGVPINTQELMKGLNIKEFSVRKAVEGLQEKGYFKKLGKGARKSTVPVTIEVSIGISKI